MNKTDNIIEIGIDSAGQLYIKPEKENFTLIWRSATEIHWDINNKYLYSPKPREWSYLDWCKHITSVVKNEYLCTLKITDATQWVDITADLKAAILDINN